MCTASISHKGPGWAAVGKKARQEIRHTDTVRLVTCYKKTRGMKRVIKFGTSFCTGGEKNSLHDGVHRVKIVAACGSCTWWLMKYYSLTLDHTKPQFSEGVIRHFYAFTSFIYSGLILFAPPSSVQQFNWTSLDYMT